MRLRFDEQLVTECVELLNVTAIEQLLGIGLSVACGIPNDSLRQWLAGSVQDAGEFAKHISPAVRLPVQIDNEDRTDPRLLSIRGRHERKALLPRQVRSVLQEQEMEKAGHSAQWFRKVHSGLFVVATEPLLIGKSPVSGITAVT
jgi:hypothetical protein